MKEEIENIIKKNLPEEKECRMCDNFPSCAVGHDLRAHAYNQALSQIDTSLIADEVLRVVVGKINGMGFVDSAQARQFAMHTDGYNQAIEDIIYELSNLSPNKEIEY